ILRSGTAPNLNLKSIGSTSWDFKIETYIPLNEFYNVNNKFYDKYINLNLGATFQILPELSLDVLYQNERTERYESTTYNKNAQAVTAQINDATQIDKDGVVKHLVPTGGQFYLC